MQQPMQQPAPTFAQMQQQGQARPAAPAQAAPTQPAMLQQLQQQMSQPAALTMAPLSPGVDMAPPDSTITTTAAPGQVNPYTGRIQPTPAIPAPTVTVGSQAYDTLQRQIQDILNRPVGYSDEDLAKMRAASVGQLEQQFGAARSALEEDLARRGLASSSIAAGRFGDLGGQQAQALAGLESNLLQQQMEAQERGRGQQLTALTALAGQRADIDARAAQLMEEARLRGREMDITEARNLAEREQSDLDRQLREKLGLAEYTGKFDGQETFAAQQARQNLLIQLAGILAQGGGATAGAMPQLLKLLADQFGFQLTTPQDDADLARRQREAADRAARDAENARRAAAGLPPLPDNTQA